MKWICVIFLLFGMVISASRADDDSEVSLDDVKKKFEDAVGDPIKGMGDWFKNTAEEAKERAQSGVETMKEFSDQAREKSEGGVEAAKGFASGMTEHFSKAKDKLEESGEKMKEALSSAVEKSKDEFETAASKISNHAKEASDTMFSLFGKF